MDSKLSDHDESHSNQYKPRRTRSKHSSVNSRLDPNFDIRERLKLKHDEAKSKKEDPRTMEFERLVRLLHPAFVLEYLQKILHFLTSSMTKMSFQNIALYKEVLLVRLCHEKSNLYCMEFGEQARKVARQIVDILKAKQNVYEWICKYERGYFCPNVLVYEKVYYTNENLQITSNGSNVIGPPLRPLESSNANGDSNSNTQDVKITSANKVHMLNTLLKFIKDNTQLKLEYPHVHKSQATLLTSLISQDKVNDTDEGFGCKSLYAPLYEALNAYKEIYDFNIAFDEDSDMTLLMTLQKTPKSSKTKHRSPRKGSHGDHKNATSSASDSPRKADPSKSSKQMTKLNFVGDINESFIKGSLEKVSDFMGDESKASLYFSKLTKDECGYLSRILQYSRDSWYRGQFPPESRALLRRIDAADKNTDWKLAIEVGKVDKATRLQSVTMRKEPHCRQSSKPVAQVAPHSHTAHTPAISPRGKNTPTKAKPISFQSAGATDKDDGLEMEKTTAERGVGDVAKLVATNTRKCRLLQAMSVPLECDKGERMMRLMGWRGGALGARGDGITEPLIPALHIAPGVGLGHIKQIHSKPTIYEFRYQFLSGVLSFLRAEESETTLEYTECLEKKKMRFVNRAIQNSKQRKGCGLTRAVEKQLLVEVFEEMEKQGKQVEGYVDRTDNRKITLKKAPLTIKKTKIRKHTNNPDSTSNNPDSTSNNPDSTSNNQDSTSNKPDSTSSNADPIKVCNQNAPVVSNIDSPNISISITETITEDQVTTLRHRYKLDSKEKSLRHAEILAHKLICMTTIRGFVEMDEEKRHYVFECIRREKFQNTIKSYMTSVIMNINERRVTPKFWSELESDIYGDIRQAIPEGCLLAVVFEYPKITLKKAPLTIKKTKIRKHTNNPNSTSNNPDSTSNNPDSTSNNPDSTSNNADPIKACNQNAPVVPNTDSPNISISITETITEKQVTTLRHRYKLDSKEKSLRHAEILAHKLICMTTIRGFVEMDEEQRHYEFECIRREKFENPIKSYMTSVIMNINERRVTPKFWSELESDIYGDIRQAFPAGCLLAVVFEYPNFTLKKTHYRKRFINSTRDLPPPKSTDLKNTIIYQNNKIISRNDVTNDDDDDDNDVILIENKIDVFEISDDEDNAMEADSETVSSAQAENSEKTEEQLTDFIIEDSSDSSLSQNLSTSRETLLLETMYDEFKVKSDIVDTDLDSDIKEIEQGILYCDFMCNEEVMQIFGAKQESETPEGNCQDVAMETMEINNNDSLIAENKPNFLVSDCVQLKEDSLDTVDCSINDKHTTDKSLHLLQIVCDTDDKTEIKNDQGEAQSSLGLTNEDNRRSANLKKSQLSTEDDHSDTESFIYKEKATDYSQNRLQTKKEDSNENREEATPINIKHPTEIPDSMQKSKDKTHLNATENDLFEDFKDRTPSNGKRSRTSSITSESESFCKKCKSQIRSVRITCKDPCEVLNTDIIRKVQSVISESIDIIIDNVDFLPRLECHGVKNGGLIYSCHDDKTFAWLTNFVVSDLDLDVTETNYPNKTYMEIKIYSFEGVEKIFNRLKLYNPELDTSLWRVVDKKEFEDFVIIVVEIDRQSFDIVNKNNYSFFAGIDKAKFNIVWS